MNVNPNWQTDCAIARASLAKKAEVKRPESEWNDALLAHQRRAIYGSFLRLAMTFCFVLFVVLLIALLVHPWFRAVIIHHS